MFRVQMGRIAARRAAYKRGFSSQASSDISLGPFSLGLMLAGYVAMHVHIHTLIKKSDANFKELRAESQAKQDKSDANFKEMLAKYDAKQDKSDAKFEEMLAKSDAKFKERQDKSDADKKQRAESDARFYAKLEEIKAITKYPYLRACQSTTTTSGELAQCLEKESPHFDMTPAMPHKREH